MNPADATTIFLRILIGFAGFIFIFLGSIHLLYTFFTKRFNPRDPALRLSMEQTTPRLTHRTTMWKAWVGFNASHSTGAIFFGFVLCFAAVANLNLYTGSQVIQAVTLLNTGFYFWLGRRYWFRIPFTGIAISLLLQLLALLVIYQVI